MKTLRPAFFAFSFAVLAALVSACKDPVEEKCSNVCRFALNCAETTMKTKALGKVQTDFMLHCEDGCTRFQSDILPCYDEAGNSCQRIMQCLLQTGLAD
ncbi:MAG: Cys-rich protein [Spirochaetia bacterium]|nr:Cys-rich protein [Spirochaetia bacterium]